jgi:DNA polymerase III delta subunit
MARAKPAFPSFHDFVQRKDWTSVPAFVILTGDAGFFRKQIERRCLAGIFGDAKTPTVQRHILGKSAANKNLDALLTSVLDELRTLSILSSSRVVVIDGADPFVDAYRDDLEPFVSAGFSGGHLILHLEKKLDARTKFAKAAKEHAWIVDCSKPFDRPPPWQSESPPWQNDLSKWIVSWAEKSRKLKITLQDAFFLQERVGTELESLDKSLEKLHIFLGPEKRQIDVQAISDMTGDTHEDSVFTLVERFIIQDRARSLDIAHRLFDTGYRPPHGAAVNEPVAITSLFIGATIPRLRNLRRAHAVRESGGGPDRWMQMGLTTRPFIDRFTREVRAMPPLRIQRAFEAMIDMDREIKTGANARTAMALFLSKI